jgi:hypothetical protein
MSPFYLPQDLNTLRASVFQKLLAKYRAGKSQYQALKKELEKLSGKLKILLPEMPLLPSLFSHFRSQMPLHLSLRLSPGWPTRCRPTRLSYSSRGMRRSSKVYGPRPPGPKSWRRS